MIATFRSRQSKQLFERESVKGFASIGRVALRKLQQPPFATQLSDLNAPPGNRLESRRVTAGDSTASGSMTNGASVLCGGTATRTTWKSWITTKGGSDG